MRFIKRLVFIVLLLVIAFFIYRLISPQGAKNLLYDIKSFSNDKIGTHFSLTGQTIVSGDENVVVTGDILETGVLQEFTDDEQLLLNDETFFQDNADIIVSTTETIIITGTNSTGINSTGINSTGTNSTGIYSTGTSSTTGSIIPPKTYNGLSAQDLRDLKKLLKNFIN